MSVNDSFQDLMTRLRAGDQDAASRIFEQFGRRLIGLARTRLTPALRAKVDPEDIVQSALRSFFCGQAEGNFRFSGWNDLWSLLAVITLRKCGSRVEYFHAAKRHVGREANEAEIKDSIAMWEPLAREPTPSEALALVEVTEGVLRDLTGKDQEIFELTLQGVDCEQVSMKLNCSERTVKRALDRIRRRLEERLQ